MHTNATHTNAMHTDAMHIHVSSPQFRLTPSLQRFVNDRVYHSVTHGWSLIRGITVRLEDVNGPHGGIDKSCRIVVWLRRRGTVVAEARQADLYLAIDAAAAKLRESLSRRLGRWRTLRRHPGRFRVYPPIDLDGADEPHEITPPLNDWHDGSRI